MKKIIDKAIVVMSALIITMITVTAVQAKRKHSNIIINNHYIIQDNRTEQERAIDRNDARHERTLNRASIQADKAQKRIDNMMDDIKKNSNGNNVDKNKYKTRKFF